MKQHSCIEFPHNHVRKSIALDLRLTDVEV